MLYKSDHQYNQQRLMFQIINELYQQNKLRKQLQLEFQQINDLTPFLPKICKFRQLKALSLHGNRLKNLPDMKLLDTIEVLDISNNRFPSTSAILNELQTMANLKHLICNINSLQQKQEVISFLSNLKYLNRQQIIRQKTRPKQIPPVSNHDQSISKQLQQLNPLYQDISEMYQQYTVFEINRGLDEEYRERTDFIKRDFKNKLKDDISSYAVEANLLSAKQKLLDFINDKYLDYLQVVDQNLFAMSTKISSHFNDVFNQMASLVLHKTPVQESNLPMKQKQQKYLKEIELLKKKQALQVEQISELENQNKIYLEKLVRLGNQDSKDNQMQNDHQMPSKNDRTITRNRSDLNKSKSTAKLNADTDNVFNEVKAVSLTELKQTIKELFKAKQELDYKCRKHSKPLYTFEEAMYLYFQKKYGLKEMAVECAVNMVNGIRLFGSKDYMVGTFGRILRNQFEQEYWTLQNERRYIMESLYKSILRHKTNKLPFQVQILYNQKRNTNLEHADAIYLLSNLYDQNYIEEILKFIKIDRQSSKIQLTFKDLTNTLLAWEIKLHERLLCEFVKVFRKFDLDMDGVINTSQFKKLYESLIEGQYEQSTYNHLLKLIDPLSSDKIIFSVVCSVFQQQPQDHPILSATKYV